MSDSMLQKIKPYTDRVVRFLFGQIRSWDAWRDIVGNNYALGSEYLAKDALNDAKLRFLLVTWLDPKHAAGWVGLAQVYVKQGNLFRAKNALRKALALDGSHVDAQALMAKISQNVKA
jgi:Tfp pilus assembly protein PilF